MFGAVDMVNVRKARLVVMSQRAHFGSQRRLGMGYAKADGSWISWKLPVSSVPGRIKAAAGADFQSG